MPSKLTASFLYSLLQQITLSNVPIFLLTNFSPSILSVFKRNNAMTQTIWRTINKEILLLHLPLPIHIWAILLVSNFLVLSFAEVSTLYSLFCILFVFTQTWGFFHCQCLKSSFIPFYLFNGCMSSFIPPFLSWWTLACYCHTYKTTCGISYLCKCLCRIIF